jgi:PAS domain S-box-containing protein
MGAPGEAAGWERLFWLVFERTSNPIILLDDERRIVEANDAAVKLFGGARDELIGTSIVDSILPAERERAAREWQAFLQSGEYMGTRALMRADGSQVQIDFAARSTVVGGRRLAIYVAAGDDPSYSPAPALAGELPLTEREREVVTLIALGHETSQIAAELHISPETVRTHVRNAMARLGAHTRAQLVAIVMCTEQAVHSACVPGQAESE